MAGNYLEMLDYERPLHFPPFAHVEDVAKDPEPAVPRNWPMGGEPFISGETNIVRQALEAALDSRPRRYMGAVSRLIGNNKRKYVTTPQSREGGVVVFREGELLLQVERRPELLIVVTGKTGDALRAIGRERRNHPDMDRNLDLDVRSSAGRLEDLFGYPVIEYMILRQHKKVEPEIINGLAYMSPDVYRIGRAERWMGYGEKVKLPQENTTAARDAILDFARRLREGNLETPIQRDATSAH